MTYDEALSFIHGVSWRGSKPGLSRTTELLRRLGNPEGRLRFIHVAGTNGKGSTSAMIACALTQSGYRTGLYTSPFISRFNERMRIDGECISDTELAEFVQRIQPHANAMDDAPTEFEIVTALALDWFAEKGCNAVVLEVGMGGRLDSTNVIPPPECAVITRIGLDHTAELGDTKEKIALEKALIIKPGCSAVAYAQESSVMQVIGEVCRERGVILRVPDFRLLETVGDSRDGQEFRYCGQEFAIRLLGEHQRQNAAVALEALEALRLRGWDIPYPAVRRGLEMTAWPARFEIISREPWFVVDGGHNPQGAESAARNLTTYFPDMKKVILMGVLADKDYESMIRLLADVADEFIVTEPLSLRALSAAELAGCIRRYGKPASVCGSIEQGVAKAAASAGVLGVACAVGSLYMAGAVRACFGLE